MNTTIRNSVTALAFASLLVSAVGCSDNDSLVHQEDPTPPETIDGSALPSAGILTGSFPTAPGIDEFTPEPDEAKPEQSEPAPACRGFRVTDVLFTSGSHQLEEEGAKAMAAIATDMPEEATIEIRGHTDDIPIAMGNQRLSELRAESVATALRIHLRPGQQIVNVSGAGEAEPIADNTTEAGRQVNRRVEILVNCGSET